MPPTYIYVVSGLKCLRRLEKHSVEVCENRFCEIKPVTVNYVFCRCEKLFFLKLSVYLLNFERTCTANTSLLLVRKRVARTDNCEILWNLIIEFVALLLSGLCIHENCVTFITYS